MLYDIAIVGCGVSGCFLALSLQESNKMFNIIMIDKGSELHSRQCPIEEGKVSTCISCSICAKLSGFGGLGKSEGKYNYTTEFGGKLAEKIGLQQSEYYLKMADKYLTQFGAEHTPYYSTCNPFKYAVKNANIITTDVRHLGTKISIEFLENIFAHLSETVDFAFNQNVLTVEKQNEIFNVRTDKESFLAKKVIISTGNSGAKEVAGICHNFDIPIKNKRVDLGLRVELLNGQLSQILNNTFEIKIAYRDENMEFMTYCMNPNGRVVIRHQEGFTFTDGQNFREINHAGQNANFAILVSQYFTPEKTEEYIKQVMGHLNKGNNRLVVQRLGDLYLNQPTSAHQIRNNTVKPSIECELGNLYDEVPLICIEGALKLISLLENLSNIKISSDTLLYGLDGKLYQSEVETNSYFETNQKDLYFIGDCTGETNSLSHAAASGIFLGEHLKDAEKRRDGSFVSLFSLLEK